MHSGRRRRIPIGTKLPVSGTRYVLYMVDAQPWWTQLRNTIAWERLVRRYVLLRTET